MPRFEANFNSLEYSAQKEQIQNQLLDYLLLRCHGPNDAVRRSELLGAVNKFNYDYVSKALQDLVTKKKVIEVQINKWPSYKPAQLK